MKTHHLFAVALATAGAVAACGDDMGQQFAGGRTDQGGTLPGGGNGGTGAGGGNGGGSGQGGQAQEPGVPNGTAAPTNSPAGKAYFTNTLHPALKASCGACHDAGPGPTWIKNLDIEASYKLQFQLGYVTKTSRILLKGPHSTTQGLVGADVTKYNAWLDLELAVPVQQAPPNVLDRVSRCMDKTLFDAMRLQDMRTTRRQSGNNTNNVTPWNENANNCTGCDDAPCRTCHAGDDATGWVNAIGNPNLPATFTFEQTKSTNPAYLQKYFGVSPTGEPVGSNALMLKATATQKDYAYTHPMFTVSTQMQGRIDAFVLDVVTKYKAGTCPP